MLVCIGHPAIGPTAGSLAYSYKLSASLSFHGRSINRSVSKIFGEDDCVDIIVENSKKVIETLETRSYVFRHVGINKIIKQTTTPIVRDGIVFGVLSVSRDVTREENLKTRLLEKNYQLNTLLENLPLLVYMKDKNRNPKSGTFKTGIIARVPYEAEGFLTNVALGKAA